MPGVPDRGRVRLDSGHQDRKSTRLNSSHSQISYAVFCLKKKNRALTVEWDAAGAERRSSAELVAEHIRLLRTREHAVDARDDREAGHAFPSAPSVVDST